MDTRIERQVRAAPETVLELAARAEDWPRILPHYRRVRILGVTEAVAHIPANGRGDDVVGERATRVR